jgi:flagellar hook-associated protein 3 FlgL
MSAPVVFNSTTITSGLISDITSNQNAMSALEQQIATGNAIQQPSDNPAGAAQILQLQAVVKRNEQYSANISDGMSLSATADGTLNQVLSILQSVQSTVESVTASRMQGPSTMSAMADQVQSSLTDLQNLANASYNGVPLFSGTGTAAFDASGTYVGAGSAPTRTVAPGVQIPVSITGNQVFGAGATGLLSTVPGNLGVLAQTVSDLQTNTTASVNHIINVDIPNLKAAIATVESAAATIGSNQQALQNYKTQTQNTQTSVLGELSGVQQVNMAQAITQLQANQTSYQEALYAASQLNADSLVKYL